MRTKYVVVCSDGTSHDMARRQPFAEWGKERTSSYDLQDLLDQGWAPVREAGMGGGNHNAFGLVVLQKEDG